MSEFRAGSPTSDACSDGFDSLSMRDKTLLKRSISKHHNNNFKAGYVPVHEQYLHKTGLRGRKTFAFWTLVGLLFILAIGNLILTVTILGVLRMGYGMQSMELNSDASAMKFFGDTDFGHVYKRDGKLESFLDYPLQINSYLGSILFNVARENGRSQTKLQMANNGTYFRHLESFEVKTSQDQLIFTTKKPSFQSLKNINRMTTQSSETNRVVSPLNEKLKLEGHNVTLKGAEGTRIEGREIFWNADQDIYLQSNGSIVFKGEGGIFVDIKRIPIVYKNVEKRDSGQYKICVCMPSGKLFKIPVKKEANAKVLCDQISFYGENNPCE